MPCGKSPIAIFFSIYDCCERLSLNDFFPVCDVNPFGKCVSAIFAHFVAFQVVDAIVFRLVQLGLYDACRNSSDGRSRNGGSSRGIDERYVELKGNLVFALINEGLPDGYFLTDAGFSGITSHGERHGGEVKVVVDDGSVSVGTNVSATVEPTAPIGCGCVRGVARVEGAVGVYIVETDVFGR